MKDIKPLINWAKENGEDFTLLRLLIKSLPELVSFNVKTTTDWIENQQVFEIPDDLYQRLKVVAEALVGDIYKNDV